MERLGELSRRPTSLVCIDALYFQAKTVPLHKRAQRPQHRVSPPWRCTDAIHPTGGSHKLSQGPTRGLTVWATALNRER